MKVRSDVAIDATVAPSGTAHGMPLPPTRRSARTRRSRCTRHSGPWVARKCSQPTRAWSLAGSEATERRRDVRERLRGSSTISGVEASARSGACNATAARRRDQKEDEEPAHAVGHRRAAFVMARLPERKHQTTLRTDSRIVPRRRARTGRMRCIQSALRAGSVRPPAPSVDAAVIADDDEPEVARGHPAPRGAAGRSEIAHRAGDRGGRHARQVAVDHVVIGREQRGHVPGQVDRACPRRRHAIPSSRFRTIRRRPA